MMTGPALDRTFAALADPTRRAILARLVEGERTVNELAAPFAISLPAISRHLKVLERAALISRIRDRQHRRCRLNPRALDQAAGWLADQRRFWDESFDRLADHLERSRQSKEKPRDQVPDRKAHPRKAHPRKAGARKARRRNE
jgi:DNA-binding transcriptional ArsR family regulator